MLKRFFTNPVAFCLPVISLAVICTNVFASDSLFDTLASGRPEFLFNYRFENVQDPTVPKDAYASTLRSVLEYESGRFKGFTAHVQFEDVRVIGNELFNDGGTNGKTRHATVVDPAGFEINEAYLSYGKIKQQELLEETEIRVGRQIITFRKAPFHRYVGPVVWRQNWQTFDGYTISNQILRNTKIHLGYIYNINRVFGEDNPVQGLHDQGVDGFLFNAQYQGFPPGQLEIFSYLLDFDDASIPPSAFFQSTQTYGVRFSGDYSVTEDFTLLNELEYTYQADYAQNPNSIENSYFLVELGIGYDFHNIIESVTLKMNYELLGGDGGADRFTTPLATLHPYQGWADKFLNTPGDGIEDTYFTFSVEAFGTGFAAVYHDFNSDNDDYEYGSELDILVSRQFGKHVTAGLKYADYEADKNNLNVVRNSMSGQAFDITKFWAWIQVKF